MAGLRDYNGNIVETKKEVVANNSILVKLNEENINKLTKILKRLQNLSQEDKARCKENYLEYLSEIKNRNNKLDRTEKVNLNKNDVNNIEQNIKKVDLDKKNMKEIAAKERNIEKVDLNKKDIEKVTLNEKNIDITSKADLNKKDVEKVTLEKNIDIESKKEEIVNNANNVEREKKDNSKTIENRELIQKKVSEFLNGINSKNDLMKKMSEVNEMPDSEMKKTLIGVLSYIKEKL